MGRETCSLSSEQIKHIKKMAMEARSFVRVDSGGYPSASEIANLLGEELSVDHDVYFITGTFMIDRDAVLIDQVTRRVTRDLEHCWLEVDGVIVDPFPDDFKLDVIEPFKKVKILGKNDPGRSRYKETTRDRPEY